MADKYELVEGGVQDLEFNMSIPAAAGNRHWKRYQLWLAEGNSPRPIKPNQYCTWDDVAEVWVEDTQSKEQAEAVAFLNKTDKMMARLGEDLISLLIDKNIIEFTELPQSAQNNINERATARLVLSP